MVIFDHSWYGRVLEERVERTVPEESWREAYRDIVEFERMLADDGAIILKFFLHISKKEQKKRFQAIEQDPLEAWRVAKADWARNKKYDQYLVAVEDMLELTESEFAPWTIVEATSKWHARRKVFDTIIGAMEKRLGASAPRTETGRAKLKDADLLVEGNDKDWARAKVLARMVEILSEGLGYEPADPLKGRKKERDKPVSKEKSKKKSRPKPG
jgi:AMP-polyphosphate phosphotransferase